MDAVERFSLNIILSSPLATPGGLGKNYVRAHQTKSWGVSASAKKISGDFRLVLAQLIKPMAVTPLQPRLRSIRGWILTLWGNCFGKLLEPPFLWGYFSRGRVRAKVVLGAISSKSQCSFIFNPSWSGGEIKWAPNLTRWLLVYWKLFRLLTVTAKSLSSIMDLAVIVMVARWRKRVRNLG